MVRAGASPFLPISSPIPVFHCQRQFQPQKLNAFLYSKDHSEA